MASVKELEKQHAKEEEEMEAKVTAHVEGVPAGKGKVARVDTAKREAEQWVFEMKERQGEELDELQAKLSGGGAAPEEAEKPKVVLSASEARKADKEAKAKADADEAEQVRLKKEKTRLKKKAQVDKEKAHEAEVERERRLNPPVPVREEKGKGYGKGEGGGGGGGSCRQFAAGNCSFGDRCRFSHAVAPEGAGER